MYKNFFDLQIEAIKTLAERLRHSEQGIAHERKV